MIMINSKFFIMKILGKSKGNEYNKDNKNN